MMSASRASRANERLVYIFAGAVVAQTTTPQVDLRTHGCADTAPLPPSSLPPPPSFLSSATAHLTDPSTPGVFVWCSRLEHDGPLNFRSGLTAGLWIVALAASCPRHLRAPMHLSHANWVLAFVRFHHAHGHKLKPGCPLSGSIRHPNLGVRLQI